MRGQSISLCGGGVDVRKLTEPHSAFRGMVRRPRRSRAAPTRMRFLRFDAKGLADSAKALRNIYRRKAKAEAYVALADGLSARYLLGPRAPNAEARARRLYAAATRDLAIAGFPEGAITDGPADAIAVSRLVAARRLVRAQLRRFALLSLPWAAIAIGLVIAATQLPPLRGVLHPRNLAAGRAWQISGAPLAGTPAHGRMPRSTSDGYFFHTEEQDAPSIQIDLGTVRRVHAFAVENRSDCCQERATPLVLETSIDGDSWKFAARRRGMFSSWRGDFDARDARYVRLRAERTTILHLRQVKIY